MSHSHREDTSDQTFCVRNTNFLFISVLGRVAQNYDVVKHMILRIRFINESLILNHQFAKATFLMNFINLVFHTLVPKIIRVGYN